MKFLLFFLILFNTNIAFADDVATSPKKRVRVTPTLIMTNKHKSVIVDQATFQKEYASKQEKAKAEAAAKNLKIDTDKYKKLVEKKQDWKAQLKLLTHDIDALKKVIDNLEDGSLKDSRLKDMNLLKYYRSIVNVHLKNYGKALVEAREVVRFDKSYLKKAPALYFDDELTLDDAMSRIWEMFRILEDFSCKGADSCQMEVAERYKPLWYEAEHDFAHYAKSEFFNNTLFSDIKTAIESHLGNNACKDLCLIGRNANKAAAGTGNSSSSTGGAAKPQNNSNNSNGNNGGTPLPGPEECPSYENVANTYSRYLSYFYQLRDIDARLNYAQTPDRTKARSWLCRGYTNVMMLDLGINYTSNTNTSYITSAKNDLKSAIALNNTLTDEDKIDEVDGIISLDDLIAKYNSIITKGMTAEDKALAQNAMTQSELNKLKQTLLDSYGEVDENTELAQHLTDEQRADIAAAYGTYSIADPNGDVQVQTAKFFDKSKRMTHQQWEDTDANLQDILDQLLTLQEAL